MADLTAANAARLTAALDKQWRDAQTGAIYTMREWLARNPNPQKVMCDGMCEWSRTKFNRMDGREQDAYEKRLRAKRLYLLGTLVVAKVIWDSVPGEVHDDTTDAREARAKANAVRGKAALEAVGGL